jgi:hypothetical protein
LALRQTVAPTGSVYVLNRGLPVVPLVRVAGSTHTDFPLVIRWWASKVLIPEKVRWQAAQWPVRLPAWCQRAPHRQVAVVMSGPGDL